MTSVLTAIRTGLRALTLFGAVPALLLATAGNPLPSNMPTIAQMQRWLDAPFDPRYASGTARTAAWLIWALIASAVLATGVARTRRRSWNRLVTRLPTPLQGVAATLIGAAAVTTAASSAAAHAAPAVAGENSAPVGATLERPGQPPAHTTASAADSFHIVAADQAKPGTVTVRRGDTLSGIAGQQLGDAGRWPVIFTLNRGRHFPGIGGTFTDPDVIFPGWQLTLPPQAAPDPRPRPGQGGREHSPAPSPSRPVGSTPSPAGPPAATARPGPESTDASAQTSSKRSTGTEHSTGGEHSTGSEHGTDGVSLPGGWVTVPLATALAGIAALLWRRRHNGRAQPVPNAAAQKADVAPALAALGHGLRRRKDDVVGPVPPPPSTTVPSRIPAAAPQEPAPAAPIGPRIAGAGSDDTGTGRAMTGPGAEAAARAVLVASLSSGDQDSPDAREHVITTTSTLALLLGDQVAQLATIRQLTVVTELPDALTLIDEILIERRRVLQEYSVDDFTALRLADPGHPPMPPVLLLTHTPPAHLYPRLNNTLLLGAGLQLRALLIGAWPYGDTATVHADGTTMNGRQSVLDIRTTVQLLDAIHEARTADMNTDDDSTGEPAFRPPAAETGNAPTPPTTAATQPAPQRYTADHPAEQPAAPGRITPVRIQLLGTPAVYDRNGEPVSGLRFHARELLVYLAVHRNGANLPDVMEAFWPTATLRRAAQRLSTEVADLRRRIRQAADDTTIQPVVNTGGRYHLDPTVVDIDLWHLLDALRRAKTADVADRPALLRRAVDAGAGSLAAGSDYSWIDPYREHTRQQTVHARRALADLIADNDPSGAAALLHTAAMLAPADEDIARRAMHALAMTGDTTAAREVLQQLHDALHDIEEKPSAETLNTARALHLQEAP